LFNPICIEVSPGDLVDKLTILEIKLEQIKNEEQLKNIRTEYKTIKHSFNSNLKASPKLDKLLANLKSINQKLWDIEDEIRKFEREKKFNERFIELARLVYITNDKRAKVKREINQLFKSKIVEEKSYTDY